MARRDITGAVDFKYLETYAAGDMDLVDEVLGLFRQQAALWSPLMDPADPSEGWRDAVHTLKGASRGIGAMTLAQACERAEEPKLKQATVGVRLAAVQHAMDLTLADIAAYLHERALQSLKSG
jgi:HPt (histidine-containing phosphotransfer) domain-containing protein